MTSADRARPLLLAGMGAIAFFALVIAGWGMLSLLSQSDVIAEPGYDILPGVIGMAAALAGWIAIVLPALRGRPGVGVALLAGVVAAALHLLALTAVAALEHGTNAGAVALHLLAGGYSIVLAVCGVLAASGVAAAARSGDGPARWPWEREDTDR